MPHCANTAAVAVVCAVQDTIKYATSIPRESVVDIRGIVKLAPTPIGSATQSLIEVHIEEVRSNHH
jgi:2-C-methyl-D-erythritol 4-phosphate cytidylyltransferase